MRGGQGERGQETMQSVYLNNTSGCCRAELTYGCTKYIETYNDNVETFVARFCSQNSSELYLIYFDVPSYKIIKRFETAVRSKVQYTETFL
jgi:hypothetical protein